ncbi:hypothetical protein Pla123a_08860 [Posidoniimonas polymericola]|uniref:Uncharacterized protein n=1 Tax=Posidoniimonas polymericola TaxID=2528002 RepID=A0A5C5YTV2_9BACT|nr:hypothetical protein [Posidoniimonas polymericola]TWT78097.1 hypothetical protein Pla123a_08860 [Posidoniimonas polymericola]
MQNFSRYLFVVALVTAPAVASAQYYYGGGQPYYNGYGGGYHASTAGESYARGMADAVRAQGEKNLADSQAAMNIEDARSANIDNRTKATNAYWERKKIYEENTAEQRYKDAQERAKVRDRNMLKSISANELDPTTGQVSWPALLKQETFDEFRKPLDDTFAKKGADGVLSSDDYLEAKSLIKQFRTAVTAQRGEFADDIISPSLRFLLKLDRELDADFS